MCPKSFLFSHHEVFMTFNPIILYKLNSEIFLALTANCDKNLIVRKHTDFLPQNGLIYTDFSLNILWTQNTALGTVIHGGAERVKILLVTHLQSWCCKGQS